MFNLQGLTLNGNVRQIGVQTWRKLPAQFADNFTNIQRRTFGRFVPPDGVLVDAINIYIQWTIWHGVENERADGSDFRVKLRFL